MKISIAISALILVLAAAFGWQENQHLAVVKATHAKLTAEAAQLGISSNSTDTSDAIRLTKLGKREDKTAVAKLAAKEFIAFAKEMEASEKKGKPQDEATQKRIMDFLDRILSLDAGQLKILIAEVKNTPDLTDETRQGLIGFSIMSMATDHPQTALTIFTESSDIFGDDRMGKQVISTSLAKWAKDDPTAALAWVRQNSEKYPDLVSNEAKLSIVQGAASQAPKTAFKLIGELGLKDDQVQRGIRNIMQAAKTPEERTASLAALRDYTSGITDEKFLKSSQQTAMENLAPAVLKDSYEAGLQWIEKAKLTPTELAAFAGEMHFEDNNSERDKWIKWLGDTIPAEQASKQISSIVRDWAESDYQAAGKWLAAVPAGPAKNSSIRAYAETLSSYEPEAAVQWAVTLPPGEDREETLSNIYDNWPKNDDDSKAAAEAFKAQHGIK